MVKGELYINNRIVCYYNDKLNDYQKKQISRQVIQGFCAGKLENVLWKIKWI